MKKLLRVISVTCLNSIFLVNLFCIVLASMIALPVSAQIACAGLNCSGGNQATFQGVQIGPCTGKFCVCATGGLHLWDFGDGGNSGSDPCVRRQITNAPNASTTFAGFAQNPLLIQGGMSENPTHVFSTATTFTVNHWFVQSGGIQHATFNITISGIGLSTLSSANTTWSCNDIENTFTGAIFYGPCMGTNLMTTDFTPPFNTGLYYTPSVMMDPQVHRGNRWNGGIYAQGAARWDGVTFQQVGQSIFKIHTQSPPFYPPSFNLPLGINPNDWFVPDPIGSPDICNEETSCTPSGITGGEGETRKKVASGEYTNPLYDGAITWQAEQQVFAALDANPAFQNEYPEVGQFYQDNQQSTIGKLHNIEKSTTQLYRSLPETREAIRLLNAAISENIADLLEIDADLVGTEGSAYQDLMVQREAKLEEATALGQELDNLAAQVLSAQTIQANALIVENASITTNAVYQANEKTVNDIYLTTLVKGDLTFTPTQTATLKAIAEQCPLSGGIGVYKARSLYALNARVYYDDEQLCAVGMQLQQPISQTLPAKSDNAFKVYPNPNTGAFTLEYPVGTTALVMLQDLTGHLIYRQVLAQDDRRKEFSVGQFQPGIYFLKIMTEGRMVHAERIIIIR